MDFSSMGIRWEPRWARNCPHPWRILIIIVGWILAVFVRAGVRRLLCFGPAEPADRRDHRAEDRSGIGDFAGVFWLIILVTLIGVFNSLDLTLASGPFEVLVKQIAAFLPRLVAGTLLVLVAWLIAVALRAIVNRALDATAGTRSSRRAGMQPMRKSVGNVLFWLVILLFVPAILAVFDLRELLEPVKSMLNRLLDMMPTYSPRSSSASSAGCSERCSPGLVTNLLAAAGADRVRTVWARPDVRSRSSPAPSC